MFIGLTSHKIIFYYHSNNTCANNYSKIGLLLSFAFVICYGMDKKPKRDLLKIIKSHKQINVESLHEAIKEKKKKK